MIQLVPIAPSGPLPENVSQIEFMIISGVELSAQRLQEVFEHAKGIKVRIWHSTLPFLLRCFPEWVPQPEVSDGLLGIVSHLLCTLKVVQTLSAGVNNVVSLLQPNVTLCNASGSHDVPVAEWCTSAPPPVFCESLSFLNDTLTAFFMGCHADDEWANATFI